MSRFIELAESLIAKRVARISLGERSDAHQRVEFPSG